jgi:hypothetical protein
MKQFILVIFLMVTLHISAQENRNVEFQVDLFNRHYWRGFVLGNSPAIEPQVTFSFNRFSFNLWAAQTFNDSYSEIDLIPSYTAGNYEISFLEYYNPLPGIENRFFNFSKDENRHSGEIMVAYNGEGKIPFRWMAATFLYGDRHQITDKHMFSTYIEIGYPFTIAGAEADISLGLSPWESFYSDRLALIHAGFSIEDQITVGQGASIPLKFSLFANPSTSEAWVIFSIGLIKETNRK